MRFSELTAKQLHLARVDVRHVGGDGIEHRGDGAGQHVLQRRRRAAIGHVLQLDAGLARQELAHQMGVRADARAAEGDLVGLGLGVGDVVAKRLVGRVGRHDQDVGRMADQRDVGEVGDHVVRQLWIDTGRDAQRRGMRDHQRVAVGSGLGGKVRADRAAGAGLVLDHHLGAESGAELGRQDAGNRVGRTAGREGGYKLDRLLGRPARARLDGGGGKRCHRGGKDGTAGKFHWALLFARQTLQWVCQHR